MLLSALTYVLSPTPLYHTSHTTHHTGMEDADGNLIDLDRHWGPVEKLTDVHVEVLLQDLKIPCTELYQRRSKRSILQFETYVRCRNTFHKLENYLEEMFGDVKDGFEEMSLGESASGKLSEVWKKVLNPPLIEELDADDGGNENGWNRDNKWNGNSGSNSPNNNENHQHYQNPPQSQPRAHVHGHGHGESYHRPSQEQEQEQERERGNRLKDLKDIRDQKDRKLGLDGEVGDFKTELWSFIKILRSGKMFDLVVRHALLNANLVFCTLTSAGSARVLRTLYVIDRGLISMFMLLEGYLSILLMSFSICSGALESPDLLLSYSMIALALHNTIILIITRLSVFQTYHKSTIN